MLLGNGINEGLSQLQKAQKVYHALLDCDTPQAFKKTLSAAIQQYPLDEFYPVVVQAELSAALMICHTAAAQVQGFAFRDHMRDFCGVKPAQLLNMKLQGISDIIAMPVEELEPMLKAFGYTVKDGTITDHPDAHRRKEDIVSLAEKRQSKHAG